MKRTLTALLALATILAASLPALSQEKDIYADPQNLKVLPKDISSKVLNATMKSFALGLGVRCETCHVGEAGKPLSTFDFESDEKEMKKKARIMIEMVNDLNRDYVPRLNDIEETERVDVRCVTCHRGQQKPLLIEDVIDRELAENGRDGALAKYAELRGEYFGSHTYDFSEFTLPMYVQGLAALKEFDTAIALAKVNAENFPESYYTRFVLAELYSAADNKSEAIVQYHKAIELNPRAKGFLEPRIKALSGE